MSIRRRAVLALPLLAGCTSQAGEPPAAAPRATAVKRATSEPSTTTEHSLADAAPRSTAPVPPVSADDSADSDLPATPTREDLIARYGSLRPSTWGTDGPGVISRLNTDDRVIALTFDACGGSGGSGYDRALIEILRNHGVPATLFLNSRWVHANPRTARELAADPLFEIAGHGTAHVPLSVTGRSAYGTAGTHGVGEVFDEIDVNRRDLTWLLGRPPRFFRPGTAHCDDVAASIAADLGEPVVGFDVNGDAGATFTAAQVENAVLTVRPGSIVIAHMNQPAGRTAEGFAAALPRLAASGYRCVRLSEHIDIAARK